MRVWVLGIVALAACTPVAPEPEPRPCMGSMRWVDAGTRWREAWLPEPMIGFINAVAEPSDGGSRVTFPDAGEFRLLAGDNDPCVEQRVWSGVAVAAPLMLPAALVDAKPVRPGRTSSAKFSLTNVTDEDLEVELTASDARFVPLQFGGKRIPGGATRETAFTFSPTVLGRAQAHLTVSVRDWSQTFEIGGFAGGPEISVEPIVEGGLVARNEMRDDVRTFTIHNTAAPTEDELADILFYGSPSIDGCGGLLTLSPLPSRIPRGQSHRGLLRIGAASLGSRECVVRQTTQFETIEFRVRWNTVVLPPCELTAATSIDAGTTFVSLTAGRDDCYLTYPRFEPANAGQLDIDWSEKMLMADDTVVIPVISADGGVVVINTSQQLGVLRIAVTK